MKNNNENTDFIKQYKGKYRLKCHIDQSTNDFPRSASGSIVSAKYSCGFSNLLDSSIIVNER